MSSSTSAGFARANSPWSARLSLPGVGTHCIWSNTRRQFLLARLSASAPRVCRCRPDAGRTRRIGPGGRRRWCPAPSGCRVPGAALRGQSFRRPAATRSICQPVDRRFVADPPTRYFHRDDRTAARVAAQLVPVGYHDRGHCRSQEAAGAARPGGGFQHANVARTQQAAEFNAEADGPSR